MANSSSDRDGGILDGIASRDAIRGVLAAYARGIDRADASLLKSCYHADAIEEHGGNFHGNAHDYVDQAMPRVRGMGVMQHLPAHAQNQRPVPPHEGLEGRLVLPADEVVKQLVVGPFLVVIGNGHPADLLKGGAECGG